MITQGICSSFLAELARGIHDFTTTTGDVFKVALYYETANLNNSTTSYITTGEITGSPYVAGGFAWTAAQNITPQVSGTTVYWSWSINPSWVNASFSTAGALIYNSTKANRAVAVFSFGETITKVSDTFTFFLPANQSSTSILSLQVN